MLRVFRGGTGGWGSLGDEPHAHNRVTAGRLPRSTQAGTLSSSTTTCSCLSVLDGRPLVGTFRRIGFQRPLLHFQPYLQTARTLFFEPPRRKLDAGRRVFVTDRGSGAAPCRTGHAVLTRMLARSIGLTITVGRDNTSIPRSLSAPTLPRRWAEMFFSRTQSCAVQCGRDLF